MQNPVWATGPERNGFVLEPASVPAEEILAGGPRRDGIPALDHPSVLRAAEADWTDDEPVLGVAVAGEARAYPVAILNWHELVNDTLGGEPILVSFCPLCGTGLVFDRRVGGEVRAFGVSGLLYRSGLLMYDRGSQSLWSQISAEAVTGPLLGQRLRILRARMDQWGRWRRDHPESTVLSRETGHRRDYDRSPYAGYADSRKLIFPASIDRRYHPTGRWIPRLPRLRARAGERSGRGAIPRTPRPYRLRCGSTAVRCRSATGGRGGRGLLVRLGRVPPGDQCLLGLRTFDPGQPIVTGVRCASKSDASRGRRR
jgi:hypothetical protein